MYARNKLKRAYKIEFYTKRGEKTILLSDT